MNDVIQIFPHKLCGTTTVPYSKSELHRVIICSFLSGQNFSKETLSGEKISNDIITTINATRMLLTHEDVICNSSGSTLRFLIPVAAALGMNKKFILSDDLLKRPLSIYFDVLPEFGVKIKRSGKFIQIGGQLQPGRFEVRGDISSQFISGLMFALPILKSDSEIFLKTHVESAAYINMTVNVLKKFGVIIQQTQNGWFIPGNQKYLCSNYTLKRDWSQAAFFLAAGALGNKIFLKDMTFESNQGDENIIKILESFGGRKIMSGNEIGFESDKLIAADVDVSQTPDLAPIISIVAAMAEGVSRITSVKRLRFKECDRLSAIINVLTKLGVSAYEDNNSIYIKGKRSLNGCFINGCNDHRIVMSTAIAATCCEKAISISDTQSVSKSYPDFFNDYKKLGGKFNVIKYR